MWLTDGYRKHLKTHDRPYKCTVPKCSYYTTGFSAEKDRDRHYQDKHDKSTPMKVCNYNCGYSSRRESNVKQHMEKAHGYEYKRTRSVRGKARQMSGGRGSQISPLRTGPPRARMASQTSTPPQPTVVAPPPQPATSSAYATPMIGVIGGSNGASPPYGPDDLSPETMQECTPEMATLNAFPPLVVPRHASPPMGISPAYIQSPGTDETFETNPFLFRNPAVAVEAINATHSDVPECTYSRWGPRTSCDYFIHANANRDAPLGGEDLSPGSDFADTFLRDAPPHIWDVSATPAIDPGLPVVPNDRYDPSRDRDFY